MDKVGPALPRKMDPRIDKLSDRQRQCLQGVLALKPAKRIAHDLGITPSAVEKHLRQAREKLGVSSTAEAAQIFASAGGAEMPQCGISYLAQFGEGKERGDVVRLEDVIQFDRVEDAQHGVLHLDHTLSPLQTITSIVAISIASIVSLLLLISCARAFESILSG